jgi:hypothetical protein
MRFLLLLFVLSIPSLVPAQSPAKNIFVITTDGLRWQEVFNGADSLLIQHSAFVKDTAFTKALYWSVTAEERRKKLMPFFWNVIARQGQLYGNREKDSKVNVRNVYKISYPGYNELLTGYPDPLPFLHSPQYNRNVSVLEYLASLPEYEDGVVSFTSWNVFPFILNKKRNHFLQNSGYAALPDSTESAGIANQLQQSVCNKTKTRYDLLTFFSAKEYIMQHHPRVVFLGLGETDEFAHHGAYDQYLQQINNVDRMIAELWYLVQTDPFYKDNTSFIISTDHGRGRNEKWTKHHTFISGSGQIWLALIGKNIAPLGEVEEEATIYQSQIAGTIAALLGESFNTSLRHSQPIRLPQAEQKTLATNRQMLSATIHSEPLKKPASPLH